VAARERRGREGGAVPRLPVPRRHLSSGAGLRQPVAARDRQRRVAAVGATGETGAGDDRGDVAVPELDLRVVLAAVLAGRVTDGDLADVAFFARAAGERDTGRVAAEVRTVCDPGGDEAKCGESDCESLHVTSYWSSGGRSRRARLPASRHELSLSPSP